MNPNTEKILYGVVGLAVGVIGTYFVMDYLQDKEIDELYAQLEEFDEMKAAHLADEYAPDRTDVHPGQQALDTKDELKKVVVPSFVPQKDTRTPLVSVPNAADAAALGKPETKSGGAGGDKKPKFDAHEEDDIIYKAPITADDEDERESESEDGVVYRVDPDEATPEEEDVKATFDGIFIIEAKELGDRGRITAKYNHDDGSIEIQKSQSDRSVIEDFDDVIDNDTLYPLIGETAYELLTDSKPDGKGVVCVRNNVLNLDFVITF